MVVAASSASAFLPSASHPGLLLVPPASTPLRAIISSAYPRMMPDEPGQDPKPSTPAPRRPPPLPTVDGQSGQLDVVSRLLKDRILLLGTDVNDEMANVLVAQLLYLANQDPDKDITLYINSPGGSVSAGLAIYDTMQFIPCDVQTVCFGMAASMGAFLLGAGAKGKRKSLPNARIMIHQPLGGAQGQAADIEIQYVYHIRGGGCVPAHTFFGPPPSLRFFLFSWFLRFLVCWFLSWSVCLFESCPLGRSVCQSSPIPVPPPRVNGPSQFLALVLRMHGAGLTQSQQGEGNSLHQGVFEQVHGGLLRPAGGKDRSRHGP